jgi:hypothetical protein
MARQKTEAQQSVQPPAEDKRVEDKRTEDKRVLVKTFQMGLPSDLLGSKLTFATSKNLSMEATPLGIIMRSKESRRKILISWANIKAAEFHWDGE